MIQFADSHGMTDIVSFRDFGYKILWNQRAHSNDLRINEDIILDMASTILHDKIRMMQYDTSTYPSFSNPEDFCSPLIPKVLDWFLHCLIKSKAEDQTFVNQQCTSIAQAIISATRPCSFTSPVVDGYGNENCTKTSTRMVHASKIYASKEITFDCSMKAVTKQDEFLRSECNKVQFISKLM